jgi:hypothetical protein
VVAVLGLLEPDEVRRLESVRSEGMTCVAILVDSASWAPLSPVGRTAAAEQYAATAHALLRAGWHVLPARAGTRLPDLWPHAADRDAAVALLGGLLPGGSR